MYARMLFSGRSCFNFKKHYATKFPEYFISLTSAKGWVKITRKVGADLGF